MRFLRLSALLLPVASGQASGGTSPEAKAYLDAALKIMEENFIYGNRIDWQQLKLISASTCGTLWLAA